MDLKWLPLILMFSSLGCQPREGTVPAAVMPTPTDQQLAWQQLEFYAFVHFNMNTFTNMEWGMGDESPSLFNPIKLDCGQWAKVCKEAGMRGIILTAKHHDGFCLWPSKYTEHSVKNSPWKNGEGDLVKELREACDEYGLKLGIYYSPWDRNHPDYGQPEYLTYMRNQLEELLTQYGEIFEVWFDGANGGTGYYGGANEDRRVDKKTYYDWDNTWELVKKWQPNTVIFSDAGPDVRWVGNEHGQAFRTMWSNLMRDSVYPGMPEYSDRYASGQPEGSHWVPGETNVSIRPGWYYHPYEDHKVRRVDELVEMYYHSIGRNTTWLLNFPVDTRGLIHENDVEQLIKLTEVITNDFASPLIHDDDVQMTASNQRGTNFSVRKTIDDDPETFWAPEDGRSSGSIIIQFGEYLTFNRVVLQEYIALGQRVQTFSVEAHTSEGWEKIADETTIGYKRILRVPDTEARSIRINIEKARACPTLATIQLYQAPKLLVPPHISRNQSGLVTLTNAIEGVEIRYTLDRSDPGAAGALVYTTPFELHEPAIVSAISVDGSRKSEVSRYTFDISAQKWKIEDTDPGTKNIIDGNTRTWWRAEDHPQITVDLGEELVLKGFTYLPMQDRYLSGVISEYAFYVSKDGKHWSQVKTGEFGNIAHSPIMQRVTFPPAPARWVRLSSLQTLDGEAPVYAEFGVIIQ